MVLVVLDSVRRDFFADGPEAAPGQAFLGELREECWRFPRVIAPAPWTVPSHASLMTGLPPWEHQLHGRGGRTLSASTYTLASTLSSAGYATASFSANPLISPFTGLIRGFDESWWGGWHECYLRGIHREPSGSTVDSASSFSAEISHQALTGPFANAIQRWPGALGTLLRSIRGRATLAKRPKVAGWVEPRLENWLARTPVRQPLFAFVNLMDAHEPYIGLDAEPPEGGRAGASRTKDPRQDRQSWLEGRWEPSRTEWLELREAYRQTFPILDSRLEAIVEMFQRANRWENSVFVVTSDHGQAFGEHNLMFHGLRTTDELVRVPLWIRPPRRADPPPGVLNWTPLASVRDMVESLVGLRKPDTNGGTLEPPVTPDRELVVSIADGVLGPNRYRLPRARLALLDRPEISAYGPSTKWTYHTVTEEVTEEALEDPAPRTVPGGTFPPRTGESMNVFLRALSTQTFPRTTGTQPGSLERLESWGY